jgi:dTDP-glucose 4,6-dehydratase
MRILITGGAGFIGSNFLRQILNTQSNFISASEIKVLDKLTYSGTKLNFYGLDSKSFEFIEGDIRDLTTCKRVTKGIDTVIHFAAESHVDRSISSPNIFIETNVLGTHNLLMGSIANSVNLFIHISTDEVYGSIRKGSWDENSLLNPTSPYSASKASSDLLALVFHKTFGLDVRVTRCTNNYGPNQFPEKIIPLFITNILQNKKMPLYGNGSNVRDWLYVEDHCRAIQQVINQGVAGEIYNFGSGQELCNLDLAKIIASNLGKGEEQITYVADRLGHDYRYSLDCTKAKNLLSYKPLTSFEVGIKLTIKWYEENGTWWQALKNTL